ncbi:putative chromate transport protein [bioreactor metagenome]|uniref:Putative chromate transport protein n=1 Tax=bioreactor metagenome TaxID=1076179 RepID=A0A645FDZ8_9ZZZZ
MKADSPSPAPFSGVGAWKRSWILFWAYIKITSLVIGGGYAIISAAQEEFVRRRRWLTEDDVIEMITITQTIPGILACNSAIYVGWRLGGFFGALAALAGSVIPSLVIIIAVAAALSSIAGFVENPYVQGAFRGVIACIVGMVAVTALNMRKKAVRRAFGWVIALGTLAGMVVFRVNPVWLILGAITLGVLNVLLVRLYRRNRPKEETQ